jgi:glycosyltransferase involved in cell wall biosynthesis
MAQTSLAARPLVGGVPPLYNTPLCLTERIETALAQSCSEFEYIFMDNCSTDGSADIAETYAQRDPRIRLFRCSQFLPQLEDYNHALAEIFSASRHCKIVQADDLIFPGSLQLMVPTFELSEVIGPVSSCW